MQVNSVHNHCNSSNLNFKANLVDSASLRAFKSGLSQADKAIFDSYASRIKKAKDKCNYIFEYVRIQGYQSNKKIATISIQNKDKTVKYPPLLADNAEKSLDLFSELANRCEVKK